MNHTNNKYYLDNNLIESAMNKKHILRKRSCCTGGMNKAHRLRGQSAHQRRVNRREARARFAASRTGKLQAQAAAEAYRRHREQVLESYRERAAAATTPEARRRLRQEVWSKRHECPEALRTVEQTLRAQETQTFYNE